MARRERVGHDYAQWRTAPVDVRGRSVVVARKPGVAGWDGPDVAAELLAEQIQVPPAGACLDLNCGSGLAGAVAAMLAPQGRVILCDRNLVAVEAARRTLATNGLGNAEVAHSDGTGHLDGPASFDLAMVRVPKERAAGLQLVWDAYQALRPDGRLYVAGANDEGIRTFLRHVEDLFGEITLLDYRRSHRVAVARKPAGDGRPLPEAFTAAWLDHSWWNEFDVPVGGHTYRVTSRPGVFSWDRLDPGTRALLDVMEVGRRDIVLDLGCGYGILGTVAADRALDGAVTMVDVDVVAAEAARRTSALNGRENCEALASDAAGAVRDRRFDLVVTNAPFHVGKATQYDVAREFIDAAAGVLRRGGRFYLVANRFLPYEQHVQRAFGNVQVVTEGGGYKVLAATKAR